MIMSILDTPQLPTSHVQKIFFLNKTEKKDEALKKKRQIKNGIFDLDN